jgi:hypothetical protein
MMRTNPFCALMYVLVKHIRNLIISRLYWCFHQQIGRNFVGENTNKGENHQ